MQDRLNQRLDADFLIQELRGLPNWVHRDDKILREYQFRDEVDANGFITEVNEIAARLDHHPDIERDGAGVTLLLTTHDAGGVTHNDITFAQEVERLAASR